MAKFKFNNGGDWEEIDAKNGDTVNNLHFRVDSNKLQFSEDGDNWVNAGTDTSDANATAAGLLVGKTAYVDGVKITGTMADKRNLTLDHSSTYTQALVPSGATGTLVRFNPYGGYAGYFDATTLIGITIDNLHASYIKAGIKVGDSDSANAADYITGTFTADATASAADIASGKTAYVNGAKLTGTNVKQYGAGDSIELSRLNLPAIRYDSTTMVIDYSHVTRKLGLNYFYWRDTSTLTIKKISIDTGAIISSFSYAKTGYTLIDVLCDMVGYVYTIYTEDAGTYSSNRYCIKRVGTTGAIVTQGDVSPQLVLSSSYQISDDGKYLAGTYQYSSDTTITVRDANASFGILSSGSSSSSKDITRILKVWKGTSHYYVAVYCYTGYIRLIRSGVSQITAKSINTQYPRGFYSVPNYPYALCMTLDGGTTYFLDYGVADPSVVLTDTVFSLPSSYGHGVSSAGELIILETDSTKEMPAILAKKYSPINGALIETIADSSIVKPDSYSTTTFPLWYTTTQIRLGGQASYGAGYYKKTIQIT